jgi:vanillate O-demethylase monooxygenase subunit
MFPKNTWYVAATSDEVQDAPFARKICNRDIVFFRNKSGNIVALEDFCPHRGAPLSLGTIVDGDLVCGYHGLRMGSEGKTVSMPKQRVDRFPCIHAYPVEEINGFIWVWPGSKELAKILQCQNLNGKIKLIGVMEEAFIISSAIIG